MLCSQTVEHHRSRKRSTIIVFVDVIAALYNFVRSLITDISPLLQDARHMDDGSGLPSALAATSLDAHVLNSVAAQFVAAWFSVVGPDTVSKFHRGVMPGDPEADQQFTLVISMLLNTLRTQLAMEGIEASIPHVPPDEAILSAGRDTPATWNLDVSYVDDIALAIPVHADQVNSPKHYSCAPSCVSAISTQHLRWKNRGSGGCLRSWCACFTHGSPQHACVQCQMC